MKNNQPGEVVEFTTQWNRLEELNCLPCHPMVCDGGIQCEHCLGFFDKKELLNV